MPRCRPDILPVGQKFCLAIYEDVPEELVGCDLLKDIMRSSKWNGVRGKEKVLVPGWRRIQEEKEQKEKEQREREQVERDTRERLERQWQESMEGQEMENDVRMTDDRAYAAGGLQGLHLQ